MPACPSIPAWPEFAVIAEAHDPDTGFVEAARLLTIAAVGAVVLPGLDVVRAIWRATFGHRRQMLRFRFVSGTLIRQCFASYAPRGICFLLWVLIVLSGLTRDSLQSCTQPLQLLG